MTKCSNSDIDLVMSPAIPTLLTIAICPNHMLSNIISLSIQSPNQDPALNLIRLFKATIRVGVYVLRAKGSRKFTSG